MLGDNSLLSNISECVNRMKENRIEDKKHLSNQVIYDQIKIVNYYQKERGVSTKYFL